MYGMQEPQLQHDEGQESPSGPHGNEEVLQVLQVTHDAQGDEVAGRKGVTFYEREVSKDAEEKLVQRVEDRVRQGCLAGQERAREADDGGCDCFCMPGGDYHGNRRHHEIRNRLAGQVALAAAER